ncbi:MAG: ATP-binding cassette domain-containing protein [Oscillospiraceae bacterium]|nr:ATP-binding cassette domain-containing protein [Oscillospiraceae bacterium]
MAVELFEICKAYGANIVLDNFSCRIEEGAVTCIMGPSGRGKTTLLRIMLGLEQPDSGRVTGMSGRRKSAVFQEDRLCDNLSAASNIRLVCRKGMRNEEIEAAMSAVGLASDCLNQTVRSMSGGQRRRVVILRALMADYDVLVMDEPFKELDVEAKEKAILHTREHSLGKTVVFVTHDESECDILGGRLIRLE